MNKDVTKKRIRRVTAIALTVLIFAGIFSCFSVFADEDNAEESCVVIRADEIIGKLGGSNVTSATLCERDGVQIVELTMTSEGNDPYISFDLSEYSASKYKYVAILACADIETRTNFGIYYHTGARGPKDKAYGEDAKAGSAYDIRSGWQFLEYDMSKATNWGGELYSIRLDYFEGPTLPEGTRCDIAAVILSDDVKAVHEAAYDLMLEIYPPVQIINNFDETDVQFFDSPRYHSEPVNTRVSTDNGSLIYSYVSHPEFNDPRVTFDYLGYVQHNELPTLTTEDFRYTVIRYRAPAIADSVMELFTLTGDAEDLFDMIRVEDTYMCHSATAIYRGTNAWSAMVLDMAEDDGLDENTALKYGWYREDGDRTFEGFRVDWCSRGMLGYYMEISDFMFYQDETAANGMSAALSSLTIGEDIYWGVESDDETTDETDGGDILPPWETEETTAEETTEETIPEYDNGEDETTGVTTEDITTEETSQEETAPEESEDESKSGMTINPGGIGGIGGIGGSDGEQTDTGSEVPFYVACGSLAALSVASVTTVATIRVKEKKRSK